MDAEDLALVLKTNLVIIRKRYTLGFCTISRPKALLNLYYQYIKVTLIRDLEGGPYKIILKFTFEFTKEYLSIKEANTFTIPEIIFDPSLILNPHLFAPPNLMFTKQLSKLYIEPRRNKLLLPLRSDLGNIPIFWRSIKTPYGHKIKDLGVITGFRQVARPYSLRYSAGKAFNKNSNVSNALRNLIMQYTNA
ncbi:C2H2 finger domain protein [Cenococcum geophilum]